MTAAFVGLGSNLGDGQANLLRAWQRLGREKEITLGRLSHPYRTAPVGIESSHWFTNAVGAIRTALAPDKLLGVLLAIEIELGRNREQGRDRTIDLDLLLYGDEISDEPFCTLPHPELDKRLFVLAPLMELAPELIHPRLGRTVAVLYQEVLPTGQRIERQAWHTTG